MKKMSVFKRMMKVFSVLLTGLVALVAFLHHFLGTVYYAINLVH